MNDFYTIKVHFFMIKAVYFLLQIHEDQYNASFYLKSKDLKISSENELNLHNMCKAFDSEIFGNKRFFNISRVE